jgi:hypothetical protein
VNGRISSFAWLIGGTAPPPNAPVRVALQAQPSIAYPCAFRSGEQVPDASAARIGATIARPLGDSLKRRPFKGFVDAILNKHPS